ncbi:translational activator of GCN4 [Borealophlyctis nickersoniae]|nr:translational activator of GCN4 [Borealophlyctis nickersoniae]
MATGHGKMGPLAFRLALSLAFLSGQMGKAHEHLLLSPLTGEDGMDDLIDTSIGGLSADQLELPWEDFIKTLLVSAVTTTVPKWRIAVIRSIVSKGKLEELPDCLLPSLLDLLLRTVPRYADSQSRKCVRAALTSLYDSNQKRSPDGINGPFMKIMCKLLERELKGNIVALQPAVIYNYATWTALLIAMGLKPVSGLQPDYGSYDSSLVWKSLIGLHVNLLDALATSDGHRGQQMLSRAKTWTNNAIRAGGSEGVDLILRSALTPTVVEGKDGARNALVIGICCDVGIPAAAVIEKHEAQIVQFYTKAILSSRTPVPDAYLRAFKTFIQSRLSRELFLKEIVAAGERLMLRSPEVVIKVFDYTARYVSFDTSTVFREKFADSLLNQMKSTNETVRADAINFFATLSSRSMEEPELLTVVDIVIKSFGAKSPAVDHRQIFYSALSQLPGLPAVSRKVLDSVPTLALKETNETVLLACLRSTVPHLQSYLQSTQPDPKSISAFIQFLTRGASDAKSGVRKAYLGAIEAGIRKEGLKNAGDVSKLVDAVIKVVEKVQGAGVGLLDSKKETPALVEGYLGIRWLQEVVEWDAREGNGSLVSLLDKTKLFSVLLTPSPPKSFVLNDKMFGKLLPASEDQLPFVHTIIAIIRNTEWYNLTGASDSVKSKLPLASALIYALAQSPHFQIRRLTHELVSKLIANSSRLLARVGRLVRIGLAALLVEHAKEGAAGRGDVSAWNDKAPRCSKEFGCRAVGAIQACIPPACPETKGRDEWNRAVEQTLMDLVVLACHPVITETVGNDLWVRLCFRAGTGPHVVDRLGVEWIRQRLAGSGEDVSDGGLNKNVPIEFQKATMNAVTLFTEVAAETVLPALVPWCLDAFDNEEARSVTPGDVAVWATPEGTLYHDPTAKKGAGRVDDRPKTAEEKWERDLKKELAAKKGASVKGAKGEKLSKAELELRQAQMMKESEIRFRVENIRWKLRSGLDVLDAILRGTRRSVGDESRDAFGMWIGKIIDVLLHRLIARELRVVVGGRKGGVGPVLAGKKAIEIFQELGEIVGDSLGPLVKPPILAAGILRAGGILEGGDGVEEKYCAVELATSLVQLLAKLQELYTSSKTFPPPAFAYMFPLLRFIILREGRISILKERAVTELVMVASDILLAHCGTASSPLVPRREMVRCLLEMLERYPRLRIPAREGLLVLSIAVGNAEVEENDENPNQRISAGVPDMEAVVGELLDGLLSSESAVRESCLLALSHLIVAESTEVAFDTRVWVARFDPVDSVRTEAERLWEEWNGDEEIHEKNVAGLLELVVHKIEDVRTSAGRALCAALERFLHLVAPTLEQLYEMYREKAVVPEPDYDDYGMVIPESLNKPDPWEARAGIASALRSCVPVITELETLRDFFNFLIEVEALGDRSEKVQRLMLDAGLTAVNANGKQYVRVLLNVFDSYLSRPAEASGTHDTIREACVILLGTLAQHLDPSDRMIPEVIDKLIETLKTPSEPVQMAVAECLPALIKVHRSGAAVLVEKLLHQLYNSPKYGERRGAAYGLAGVVKGCGISSLKDFQIMSSLKDAVEDKKKPEKREGAVFAFETLSQTLGRLFEPYVIQILPLLLVCFGDSNRSVREATEEACRVIMSKLSGHCVKLVMPSLLNGLDDKNWRAKTGSIEVLGSMAFLAPKQLSVSLPTVVPRLCDVLADSHAKVQEAAKQALTQFGGVIKNPEIQALVPTLLVALVDPNNKTSAALSALLDTSFVHYIDAPSLALLVPILQRGLKERSAEVKKKAAQIMGNMASLTEHRDLIPYLPGLMPGLKEVLVDPVPQARAIAAKALGNMIEKLGEDNFPELVPELIQTLKSDTSGVDRSGAAQGLSEVIAGLGLERLEGMLPEIVANASSNKAYVREGFMTLLIYLPATHGEKFTPYLGQIIPPILRGLADESEPVRHASMRSGQMIVRNYASSAVDLLLPELESGLFDENWRIRQSSLQLMGDLLYRIAGISGKVEEEGEEDEGTLGTEIGRKSLVAALGQERYERVLASLYIVRADSSAAVRQASLHVWKAIVHNTPRTLKEILPVLMNILIANLASESMDRRNVAARTLGELVRKLGDAILNDIVPILEKGLDSQNADTRQGVCVGMTEIMASAGKAQLEDFVVRCTPLVRKALVDEEPDIREAAAQAFDMLHQNLGSKAIDEVLPMLLNELKSGSESASSKYALEALKEIMTVRSNVVFPVLIPTLIARPITSFNARALGSLITVAGQALNKRLNIILPALMDALEPTDAAVNDAREALHILLVNVEGEDGVYHLMTLLTEATSQGGPERQRAGCEALKVFCDGTREALSTDYIGDWVELLVGLMRGGNKQKAVVEAAWGALDAVLKKVAKEDLDGFVAVVRRGIRDAEEDLGPDEVLEGFCLPKGISPLLPVFSQGLMYGSPDVREQAALGLGDLVRRTSPEALRPYVTTITGPLIRVIGDRFPAGVKSAILQTLGLLLGKVPAMLKPFLPQLQRTFVKSLTEPSSGMVRDRAARCLTTLITLQTRLDPLVVELAQGVRSAEDRGVKEAMWEALYGLLKGLGPGRDLNAASRKTVEGLIVEALTGSGENDDGIRRGAAKCLGIYCKYVGKDDSKNLITSQLAAAMPDVPWPRLHGIVLSLFFTLVEAPVLIQELGLVDEALDVTLRALKDDKPPVSETAVKVTGRFLSIPEYVSEGSGDKLIPALAVDILPAGKASTDARREALIVLKNTAKASHATIAPHISSLVSVMMLCARDRTMPIKLAAERALFHVLDIGESDKGGEVLQRYLKTLDSSTARNIGDYTKRVLSKMVENESDEGE